MLPPFLFTLLLYKYSIYKSIFILHIRNKIFEIKFIILILVFYLFLNLTATNKKRVLIFCEKIVKLRSAVTIFLRVRTHCKAKPA